MRRELAKTLMGAVARIMPRDRRAWAKAMARELDEIENDGEALSWAAGALWSASLERGLPVVVVGGRVTVAVLTVVYALAHLAAAWWGLGIMLFGQPDWYHDKLIEWGRPEAAAARVAMRPWLALFMLSMGVSHLGAAVFLAWWRPRVFAVFATAALIATLFVSLGGAVVSMQRGVSGFWWVQTALAVLMIGAAILLAQLDRRRRAAA